MAGLNTSYALPMISTTVAEFLNLPGAVDAGNKDASGGGSSSNVGAITGGVIGAVIAVGVIVAGLIAFLVYRRRQAKAREEARKEENRFVDLDGDEDGNAAALGVGQRRRRDDGVSQT